MHLLEQEEKKRLFQYEILRAKFDIRDFYLKNLVRDVYENIGQVLSLVRIQLSIADPNIDVSNTASSGELVGQSIRALRSMTKSFFPDTEILKEDGFVNNLMTTVKQLDLQATPKIMIKGEPVEIPIGLKLIGFNLVQELLISIKDIGAVNLRLAIHYYKSTVSLTLLYDGEAITIDRNTGKVEQGLNMQDRFQLLDANIQIIQKTPGTTRIKLTAPLNIPIYE